MARRITDSGLALDEDTIAWGDLDGDGDIDYFGKIFSNGYVVQLNDGSGNFNEGWKIESAQTTNGGIALADFDGDGDLDALVANGFRETGGFPSLLFWTDGSGLFMVMATWMCSLRIWIFPTRSGSTMGMATSPIVACVWVKSHPKDIPLCPPWVTWMVMATSIYS
jgi:hypothetical protein